MKPVIISTKSSNWRSQFDYILSQHPNIQVVDNYQHQIQELFTIRNPIDKSNKHKLQKFVQEYLENKPLSAHGNWIFLPWRNSIIHLLTEDDFFEVRTARNKPIIASKIQHNLYNLNIGVIGLSVGNSIIKTLVYSGCCRNIKVADMDVLEVSNLNRLMASISDLNKPKVEIIAEQIYDINPYANVIEYPQGISKDSIQQFLTDQPSLDIVLDECDDINLKKFLRLLAKKINLPLMSLTDAGFESKLDLYFPKRTHSIGQYYKFSEVDTNILIKKISNLLSQFENNNLVHQNEKQNLKAIVQIVGINNIPTEMMIGSIAKVKQQVAGWPQLAMTVNLGGSLATYILSRYVAGEPMPNDQITLSLSQLLDPDFFDPKSKARRQVITNEFNDFLMSD